MEHYYSFKFDGEPEAVAALMTAMAKAQAEVSNAAKASVNPAFNSRYADIAAILSEVRPAATAQGLWISQPATTDDEGRVGVQTIVAGHGAVFSTGMLWQAMPASARNMSQEMGKAITYARRYQLSAVWSIAQEDDDGNSMQGAPPPTRSAPPRQQSQPRQQQPAEPIRELYGMLEAAGFSGNTPAGIAVTDYAIGSLVAGATLVRCQNSPSTLRKVLDAARAHGSLVELRRQAEADHAAEGAS